MADSEDRIASVADPSPPLPSSGGHQAADNSGLVNGLKDKLQDPIGHASGYIESLPPKIQKRVEALQKLQDKHKELEAKFFEERAALEAKYQTFYEPLYQKRCEIVNGTTEVADTTEKETEPNSKRDSAAEEKGVPEFWLTAMKNNEVLEVQITERDEGALKHLKDIKWSRLDNVKGFKLEFFFDENTYFRNTVLTKTYHMIDENEPVLERAIGTEIDWLPGKNLTQKVMKKKPKKGAKNAKPMTKIEQCASFFNFFYPPKIPDDDEDIDADAAEELQELMEQDFDIGSTIRDKIIPHAVSWYTGEAEEGDDDDDDDDDDDSGDDDDEEGDEEDEEDDENEVDEEENHEEEDHSHQKHGGIKTKPRRPVLKSSHPV